MWRIFDRKSSFQRKHKTNRQHTNGLLFTNKLSYTLHYSYEKLEGVFIAWFVGQKLSIAIFIQSVKVLFLN